MANTVIQIKRSTVTTAPTTGSLSAAEPAYSYLSDKLFIGSSDGSQVIEIGGRYYVNTAIQAYNQANSAQSIAVAAFEKANTGDTDVITAAFAKANDSGVIASQAFDKANSANLLAYNTGIGANAYADAVGAGSNNYLLAVISGANSAVGAGANNFLLSVIAGANTAVGAGANAYADSVSVASGTAANVYADSVGAASGTGANNYSNATFVKLTAANQTITGDLAVTGSLTVSGNAFSIETETLRVSDPLIYLAGNNYTSDIVDIGFVANYSTGSANLHTGIFRDATVKEYYVFDGYNEEPHPNHIDTSANGFNLAVLNATIRTSNLILGGANAILTIASVGTAANAFAAATIAGANTAVGAGANSYADAVGAGSNNYLLSVISGANTAVGAGANSYATAVGAAANTNASNASYLSTGTVPSDRVSGSYTGITGVGTLTAGVWNATTISVPYGGTGATTFANNGILFGNLTNPIRVTAAGTEGNVLQVNAQGTPLFGMLDGGSF